MKKQTYTSISLVLLFTASSLVAVSAQITPTSPETTAAPLKATVAEQCQKVTEKVDLKISNYSEAHSNFDTRFSTMIEKVRAISEKLSAKGIDTSVLSSSITALEAKRAKLATDKQAFISKLQESKQFTCGASQGQFKTKISEAKALQKVVVQDSKDMQTVAKTIRESLKGLRATVSSSTQAV